MTDFSVLSGGRSWLPADPPIQPRRLLAPALLNVPTVPAWPATLPQFVRPDSFAQKRQSNSVVFPTEVGPAKKRRRGTSSGVMLQINFWLNAAQRQALDDFHYITCADGSLYFTWVDPVTQAPATFQWGDAPTFSQVGPVLGQATFSILRLN